MGHGMIGGTDSKIASTNLRKVLRQSVVRQLDWPVKRDEHAMGQRIYKAMVVDDNPLILKTTGAMVSRIGYRVTMASDGCNALFGFQHDVYDLVLTDFAMPALNGYQIGRHIKKKYPRTKVAVMTGLCQAEVADFYGNGGIDAWLFKPFNLNDLEAMMMRIGLPYIDPRAAKA